MEIMTAKRTAQRPQFPSFPRLAWPFASAVLLPLATIAADPTAPPSTAKPSTAKTEPPPAAQRSHIQPVGEVAQASRDADSLGMRLTRAPEVLRRQLGLARGAGLVVEEVVPDSTADKAGFRQHDVLVLLDDQMLLLPEQLAALLDAAPSGATPACTLLRGGGKVTVVLTASGAGGQPAAAAAVPGRGSAMPTFSHQTGDATRQTAAKPSTTPRLRAPASTLALVQGGKVPTRAADATPTRNAAGTEDVLLREDADFRIKLSRGKETRLVVLDPEGRIVFNDAIDAPEQRGLVPVAVRQRVEEMERSLDTDRQQPVLEIGRLDAAPVEIR